MDSAAELDEWDPKVFQKTAVEDGLVGAEDVECLGKERNTALKRLTGGVARDTTETSRSTTEAWYRLTPPLCRDGSGDLRPVWASVGRGAGVDTPTLQARGTLPKAPTVRAPGWAVRRGAGDNRRVGEGVSVAG